MLAQKVENLEVGVSSHQDSSAPQSQSDFMVLLPRL